MLTAEEEALSRAGLDRCADGATWKTAAVTRKG
jgi:hypothetical protein